MLTVLQESECWELAATIAGYNSFIDDIERVLERLQA